MACRSRDTEHFGYFNQGRSVCPQTEKFVVLFLGPLEVGSSLDRLQ